MQLLHRGAICLLMFLLTSAEPSGYGQAINADFALGLERYGHDDWPGAITNFSKAIAAAYNLDRSYRYRAYARSMLDDSAGALADCAEFIKLNPTFSGSYFWRSRINLNLTNYDDALADYITGVRLNPQAADTNLASKISHEFGSRATHCFRADNLSGAISNLNVVVFLCPKAQGPYIQRAQFKLFQGRYGAALADADLALKYGRVQYMAWVVRAWSRLALNDVQGAGEDYDKINAWLDEQTARKKSDQKFWQEDRLLADMLADLIKGKTQTAAKKLQALMEFSSSDKKTDEEEKAYMQTYREHWQKLTKNIIAKTKDKKN